MTMRDRSTVQMRLIVSALGIFFIGLRGITFSSPPPFPEELGYPNVIPPLHQFGEYGSAPGQMNEPLALAIDSEDQIFITDTFNNRINVYSSKGQFVNCWGSLGQAPSEFRFPQAIAISEAGEVYVADTGNHRIQVFDRKGNFLRTWGNLGGSDGAFNEPVGIAVWKDVVAVADRANERVQLFTIAGRHRWTAGGFGRDVGKFDYPSDLAFDSHGSLYVADSYNNRIQKLDNNGHVLRYWGGWGSYSGLLANPSGVAVHDERVFVTDLINHRVQVFDLDGQYLYQWGRHPVQGHEGKGRLHYPSRLAVSRDGTLVVVCEPFEYRCQVFNPTSFSKVVNVDDRAWWDKAGRFHYGSRVAAEANVLTIAEPDTHSVLVFDISQDEPAFITRIGNQGRDVGSFVRPSGMAIDAKRGQILISDGGNHRLQVFELAPAKQGSKLAFAENKSTVLVARSVLAVGLPEISTQGFAGISPQGYDGSGNSPVEPGALRTGPDGNYYLADPHNARILVLDKKLNLVRSFGRRGSGPGELLVPNDLAFSKDGNTLYVVDTYNFRIVAFSPEGTYKFEWGHAGPGKGEFIHPFGITSGKDGFVYVSDDAANRVQKFEERGTFVKAWGRWGTEPGQFYKPKGLAQDDRGRIIITDFGNHRAQIMDSEGNFISMFGIGEGYTPPLALADAKESPGALKAPLVSNGGMYILNWHVVGGNIPLNKSFDVEVTVLESSDHEPADGTRLTVSALMPAHYHGMNVKPAVEQQGAGRWLVRGILLHMPGDWQIAFDVDNGIVTERAQFDVIVK